MKEQLFKMIFYFDTGAISDFDIIQWAMNQVVNGHASDLMMKLASSTGREQGEVALLFQQIIENMGYDYPLKQAFGFYRAKLISENMINGKISALQGCSVIGRICSDLEWPEILADFELLSHQCSIQENLEVTEKGLTQDIISAAYKLIDKVNAQLNLD